MVERLERYGVKFEKTNTAVRRAPRPPLRLLRAPHARGQGRQKALYRVLQQKSMREKIRIENRLLPVRVLTEDGRAVAPPR